MNKCWLLFTSSVRKSPFLVWKDPDAFYFRVNFVGASMEAKWAPPPLELLSAKSKVRDFVSGSAGIPVVSSRAKTVLQPLTVDQCEFLPLIEIQGEQYYAINVTNIIDCLDIERSDVRYFTGEPKRIMAIHQFIFDEHKIPGTAVIFKIPDLLTTIPFVTKPFVDAVIANHLTGAAFADPSENLWGRIVRKQPLNVVPGVLD